MAIPVPSPLMLASRAAQPLDADTRSDDQAQQKPQPAFVTAQSFATFSVVSGIAAALWKLIAAAVSANWADKRWVPAVICAAFGIYLILKALESATSWADRYGAVLIGVVNTAFLWSAVVGFDIGLDDIGVADSTAAPASG